MTRTWILWVPFWILVGASHAGAHKPSDSYLKIAAAEERIDGRWDVALRDLDYAIGLDADDNGEITWGELRERHRDIAAYTMARLQLRSAGAPCALRAGDQLVDYHTDGAYSVLQFTADCGSLGPRLDIEYSLLFDQDPQHRGLLIVESRSGVTSAVLSPGSAVRSIEIGEPGIWQTVLDYGVEGVRHIWSGIDHVLFLLTLLFPAVLYRTEDRWMAVPRFRSAFVEVLKIVTSFTLAHSLTLSAAARGTIALPSAPVESAIALSVLLAALNNIYPLVTRKLWLVAFSFGLVHGLGFASVLSALGLPKDALLVSLVSFNLGVELGQIAIVALFLPLAYRLRTGRFYPAAIVGVGSAIVAAVASLWLIERAF